MHPRGLRCSSFKYSRYCSPPCTTRTVGAPPVGRRAVRYRGPQRGSRAGVVVGAPRPSRCDARLSPRAAKERLANLPRRHGGHGGQEVQTCPQQDFSSESAVSSVVESLILQCALGPAFTAILVFDTTPRFARDPHEVPPARRCRG